MQKRQGVGWRRELIWEEDRRREERAEGEDRAGQDGVKRLNVSVVL